ncbi:hypothetical protein [Streptomyces afghaniensis]|uniref:hypothetical protein n=1 Tax=Streptomyces afghaniensis TaxID=66865 RepID=UPI000568CF12|nr:hypothetical protein [Streptomyces afghaniensis]
MSRRRMVVLSPLTHGAVALAFPRGYPVPSELKSTVAPEKRTVAPENTASVTWTLPPENIAPYRSPPSKVTPYGRVNDVQDGVEMMQAIGDGEYRKAFSKGMGIFAGGAASAICGTGVAPYQWPSLPAELDAAVTITRHPPIA